MKTAQEALDLIERATVAEDLFGPISSDADALRKAKRLHRQFAVLVHPDRANTQGLDHSRASSAFARMASHFDRWMLASDSTTRPSPAASNPTVRGSKGTYELGEIVAQGTISTLYRATSATGEPVAVKMPRKATSSRFVEAERVALEALAAFTGQEHNGWLSPYYPTLVDHGTHRATGTSEERQFSVLSLTSATEGFVTLKQVRAAYPQGLDGRDWAWMHRRLLMAVAGAHQSGLVHGAILPKNVFIHPEHHGVVLSGWSFTTPDGSPLAGRVASGSDAYPADVVASPALDVYMLHHLMQHMLRADERAQRAFASGCMQPEAAVRPSAVALMSEFDLLLERLYGPRRFRPFTVPSGATDKKE